MQKTHQIMVAIFVIVMGFSAWAFHGTLGSYDAFNMLGPYPLLDATGGTTIADGFFNYISEWYSGQNGRLSQSILGAIVFEIARLFWRLPEDFPSWFFKGLSLSFISLVVYLSYKKSAKGLPVLLLMLIWGYSRTTINYPLWLDICSLQYFFPFFLFFLIPEKNETHRSWTWSFAWGLLSAFISNCTEHFLILTISYFGIQMLLSQGRRERIHFLILSSMSTIGAFIFYFSPGQRARAQAVKFSMDGFGIHSLVDWYRSTTVIGYQGLLDFVVIRLHLSVFNVSHLLFIALASFLALTKNSAVSETTKKYAMRSLGFFISYSACLLTRLVSPYLPAWSVTIPAGILAMGLGCLAMSIIEVSKSLPKFKYTGAVITSGCTLLLLAAVYRETPVIIDNAKLVIEFSKIRKAMYKKVLNDVGSSETPYIYYLDNFPRDNHGWSIDAPWCFSAYFRWVKKTNIQVVIPGEEYAMKHISNAIVRRLDFKDISL